MTRPLTIIAVFALLALPLPAGAGEAAEAYARPGLTERVSLAIDGSQGDGNALGASVSADGRYVAFASAASNLVPGDTNDANDVFVHDRVTAVTERVSVASDGAEANAGSTSPSISADGRYVAFVSSASNLVPLDTNKGQDVFVHDRVTGTTERVSVASDGSQAQHRLTSVNPHSSSPSTSADGRFVAFTSNATNFVPGDNSVGFAIFVHDRDTGKTELMSAGPEGKKCDIPPDVVVGSTEVTVVGGATANASAISGDGRYVAFSSSCTDLVPDDTNRADDVFVHDRETGVTERVSVASDGTEGDGYSIWPSISGDGRYVAFFGQAGNLVPDGANPCPSAVSHRCVLQTHVFVHDRETGETERVSVASDGTPAEGGDSFEPAISADGRHVAFVSGAPNLTEGMAGEAQDVFVHDRVTRTTELVSVAADGTGSNADTRWPQNPNHRVYPSISGDGAHVAFRNAATNLVPDDTNDAWDAFVRERGGPLGFVGGLSVVETASGVDVSGLATFSGEVIAEAADPDDDGAAVGPLSARDLGGELNGASVVYRPERGELLLRLRLAALPPAVGGLPSLLYGLDLTMGSDRFQVRALRAAAGTASPAAPYAALYRCDVVCLEDAALSGSVGSTGEEVLVALPLAALGATGGTALSDLRAFTALGEAVAGAVLQLDELVLDDAAIPSPRVEVGTAPSTGEGGEGFLTEAEVQRGAFSGTVPTSSLSPGDHRVWARSCLGQDCGPAAIRDIGL